MNDTLRFEVERSLNYLSTQGALPGAQLNIAWCEQGRRISCSVFSVPGSHPTSATRATWFLFKPPFPSSTSSPDLIASDSNEVSSSEELSISWCNYSAKSDRSVNVQQTDGINLSGLAFNHFQSFFNEAKVVKQTFLFLKLHSATRDRLS